MTILPIDEINALEDKLSVHFDDGRIRSEKDRDDIIDELLDLFLLSYAMGYDSVGTGGTPPLGAVEDTVYRRIDGKTWVDRVRDYFDSGGSAADITRIATTEAHRDAVAASYDAAVASGKTKKTWHCMMLDTSRDDHIWLDGVSAPIDGYFYAPGGERTQYPGEWGVPEQDCNCLCWLTYE